MEKKTSVRCCLSFQGSQLAVFTHLKSVVMAMRFQMTPIKLEVSWGLYKWLSKCVYNTLSEDTVVTSSFRGYRKSSLIVIFVVLFICSIFTANQNKGGTRSALLSLRHPVTMNGDIVFMSNMGGAITLLQTQLDISGQILFEGNVAKNGGGITLLDHSIVMTNTSLAHNPITC